MVKIIIILTIVYYCEINAGRHYLPFKEGPAVFRSPFDSKEEDHAGIKLLNRRSGIHRYTRGSRKQNNYFNSEFAQSDSDINIFFKPGVVNRRNVNKINTLEKNTRTDEFDNERYIRIKDHLISEKDHTQKRRFMGEDDKKISKHPKDTSNNHEREKYNLNNKKQGKENSKDKKEEQGVDRDKAQVATTSTTYSNIKKELKEKKKTIQPILRTKNKIQFRTDPLDENESVISNLSPYALRKQINQLMTEFPEANVSVTKAARTVEYNDILMVTISEAVSNNNYLARESKYMDDVPEKKIIFIVHGLTVMGLKHTNSLVKIAELKLLLSYYLRYLDKFDFILIPLANPDGYSASLASDRTFWNKNVSPQDVCSGVFLDRNFDVAWKNSHDISSCSQLYPGANPFSEHESKAVRNVLHRYSHKILAYIHVHAGTFDDKVFKGDAILYPRGYTTSTSDDDKYIDLKGEIDEAMRNASFRVMSVSVDTLANWYGQVSGTSVDYAASVYGIPYALEFVMQIYDTEDTTSNTLTEIWSRLIDTTFSNMWKNLQRGADARRKHF